MPEILRDHAAIITDELRNHLEEAVKAENKIDLLRLVQAEHPADVAAALDQLPIEFVVFIFKAILLSDVGLCALVLVELEDGTISQLYEFMSITDWAWIFTELSDDDTVAILELFPLDAQSQLVAKMPHADKEDVLELMTYPEDSAGRIMTNEFLAMDLEETVAVTVEKIRKTKDMDPTNLFFVYVTEKECLVGMVSLRQLLLGKKTERLKTIMRRDVTAVDANLDQEEVAEIVRKHDEVTVPVVDDLGRILGIITVDDIIDVIDEESDEDIYKMVGTSDEELLAGDNILKIVGLRLPWIFAAFCGSMLVAFIMHFSESGMFGEKALKIFVFVPLICAMGGNVGVQSSTIMARYLSTNTVDWREARRTTFKEAKIGFSLGMICGILVGLAAYFLGGWGLSVTVVTAMMSAMTTAAITGTIIPVLMKRVGVDPALATGPFVTSFNDVVATIVYFGIAFLFLQYVTVG